MFVPRLTPTSAFRLDAVVDFNFGLCEYPFEPSFYVRCLCVLIKAFLDATVLTLFCSSTQLDLPRQILSTRPRASAAFAVELKVKVAGKAGLRRRLLLTHSICSIDAAAHNFVASTRTTIELRRTSHSLLAIGTGSAFSSSGSANLTVEGDL